MLSIGKLGKGQERSYLDRSPKARRIITPARARRRVSGSATPLW